MSTAIENLCFENDEKPNLRGGSHGMFDVGEINGLLCGFGCCSFEWKRRVPRPHALHVQGFRIPSTWTSSDFCAFAYITITV